MKPHIEITPDSVDRHKEAHLLCNGWIETVSESGKSLWTKTNLAFDADNMTTDDAYKLQCMIDQWGKDTEQ